MIAPFAPHLSEELWKDIGNNESIHLQDWPKYDLKAIELDEIKIIIQINGKVRGNIQVNRELSKVKLAELAINSDVAKKWTEGKQLKRVIVVPSKLVNIVI